MLRWKGDGKGEQEERLLWMLMLSEEDRPGLKGDKGGVSFSRDATCKSPLLLLLMDASV